MSCRGSSHAWNHRQTSEQWSLGKNIKYFLIINYYGDTVTLWRAWIQEDMNNFQYWQNQVKPQEGLMRNSLKCSSHSNQDRRRLEDYQLHKANLVWSGDYKTGWESRNFSRLTSLSTGIVCCLAGVLCPGYYLGFYKRSHPTCWADIHLGRIYYSKYFNDDSSHSNPPQIFKTNLT